ncbi:hypothetical protein C8R47DRAFT_1216166 [Mycena vitilis]|nr:hypothetical protein C8R47DRAFT_1216166 [Mycena vitilis]
MIYAVPKHTAPWHHQKHSRLLLPFRKPMLPFRKPTPVWTLIYLRVWAFFLSDSVSRPNSNSNPNSNPPEMTSFPAATTAPSAHEELRAVIAAVTELLDKAHELTTSAQALYDRLPGLIDLINEEAAEDNIFVRASAKTLAQVTAEHLNEPDGSRPWWVVYVGREPGLYTTIEAANRQIKGCPGQEYRKKSSKVEALAFYALMHEDNAVEKWVELVQDK